MSDYPQMFRVRQHFERPQVKVDAIAAEVDSQLKQLQLEKTHSTWAKRCHQCW